MELGINEDAILRTLLSSEMYEQYMNRGSINHKFGGVDITNLDDIDIDNSITELFAFRIFKRAIKYTPIDTSELLMSIYIKKVGNGYEIGYTSDYAIYVHEVGFNIHESPTQYKFLEDAAYEIQMEHYSDTGIVIPINIQYSPLRIFIGVLDSQGESLTDIKNKSNSMNNVKTYEKLLNNFLSFDIENADDSDMEYYNHMNSFFNHYRTSRHYSDWEIIMEYVDRNRHG